MEELRQGKNPHRLETSAGLPVFLLADRVPGALTAADDKNWQAYCAWRAEQGFNAVLFDPLPAEATEQRLAELSEAADAAGLYVLHRKGLSLSVHDAVSDSQEDLCTERDSPFLCSGDSSEPIARLVDATTGTASIAEARTAEPALPVVAVCARDSVRFAAASRREMRAALWHAILAGAVGGVVYQAAELFDWSAPAPALQLPAAEDFAFAAQAVEYFDLTWGEPWDEILQPADRATGTSAARTSSTALIYVPKQRELVLNGDFTETVVQALDLTTGEGTQLNFTLDEAGNSHIPPHPFKEDSLYVIRL